MRFYVPTKGRADAWLGLTGSLGLEVVPVVAGERQAAAYAARWGGEVLHHSRPSAAGAGKAVTLNWIADEFGREGEWLVFLDDDIQHVTGVPPGWEDMASRLAARATTDPVARAEWSELLETRLTGRELARRIHEGMARAEAEGAWLWGQARGDNAMFRRRPWSRWTLVAGCCFALRVRRGVRVPETETDEVHLTGIHLDRDGRVLVDRWLHVEAHTFQGGGHGGREERRHARRAACADLVRRWPHLFRIQFDGSDDLGGAVLRRSSAPAALARAAGVDGRSAMSRLS